MKTTGASTTIDEYVDVLRWLEQHGGRIGVVGAVPDGCYQAFSRRVSDGDGRRSEMFLFSPEVESPYLWMASRDGDGGRDKQVIQLSGNGEATSTRGQSRSGDQSEPASSGQTSVQQQTDEAQLVDQTEQLAFDLLDGVSAPRANLWSVEGFVEEVGLETVDRLILDFGHDVVTADGLFFAYFGVGLDDPLIDEMADCFDAYVELRVAEIDGEQRCLHRWVVPSNSRVEVPVSLESPWFGVDGRQDDDSSL